jgi:hypothetical protein
MRTLAMNSGNAFFMLLLVMANLATTANSMDTETTQPGLAPGSYWHFYAVTLRHDAGKVKLKIAADSEMSARTIACACEGAPERAVLKVEQLGLI